MVEMVRSAFVQETVSRGVSFVLGKHEEKACQGHAMERLEMAVIDLELALERSAKLPITDVSLLQSRKMIRRAYVEAAELLNKHRRQQPVQVQEEVAQGVKRKRSWIVIHAKNLFTSSPDRLKANDVQRFEWFADRAGKFVRDVESGCSLRNYTFCNPIARHLLERKTIRYQLEEGNWLRYFCIWPTCSEERGVEAVLEYRYRDSTVNEEKSFSLLLVLRLSESVDIVGVATKGLQFLTSQFKVAAESAIGELTLLPMLLHDISHSCVPQWIGIQEWHTQHSQHCRPDPSCCKGSRHGLCGSNNDIVSEIAHIFPEEVIYLSFDSYISAVLGPPVSRGSSEEVGRSVDSRGWASSPLAVKVAFAPHFVDETLQDSYAVVSIENVVEERRAASIEQVAERIKSNATNLLLRKPDLMEYRIDWFSRHGTARFEVEKPRIECVTDMACNVCSC